MIDASHTQPNTLCLGRNLWNQYTITNISNTDSCKIFNNLEMLVRVEPQDLGRHCTLLHIQYPIQVSSYQEATVPATKKSAASNPEAARSLNPGGSRPYVKKSVRQVANLL